MIKSTELAWFAGLLDVKYDSIRKSNSHDHGGKVGDKLTLWLRDKNFEVIDRAAKMAGSNITPRNPRPATEMVQRACIEHCKQKHVHRLLIPTHEWKIYGISAVIIYYNVMPYMVHAMDIEVDARIQDTINQTKFRGEGSTTARVLCQKLSQLGWKIPPEIKRYMR